VKYYSVDIQVDFVRRREMPPRTTAGKPWRAVGYFQYFNCTERSKERAKEIALDFVRENEALIHECRLKCIRVAWMRTLQDREEIAFSEAARLTEAMFARKDHLGIWFHTERAYYVSELDAALDSEEHAERERRP
jgi:hypothetical protein